MCSPRSFGESTVDPVSPVKPHRKKTLDGGCRNCQEVAATLNSWPDDVTPEWPEIQEKLEEAGMGQNQK